MAENKRYITTPIYYVNDRPHIGHIYTTLLCDVYARFMRFAGRDVFFLTGTDEHAAKVVEAARERGLSPQQWADENASHFETTFKRLGLTHDDFIRTTEPRHTERVQKYVQALIDKGDVYLGEYEGWYDAGQEEYVPENKAREYEYKSPINGKPLVRKAEQNYFFALSKYRDDLLRLLEKHDTIDGCTFDVQPDSRRNEIVHRIRNAEDVPISRAGESGWGIPMPGDESHTIYVWIDALFNYLTTVDTDERRGYWQCAGIHVIAKDILWFHAAIWPAVLLALRQCKGYEWVNLPRLVYSHSFWISEGRKMSKSLGNFIDLEKIDLYVGSYSLDALRYFLTTQGPLGSTDADFAAEAFHEVYHADLVNTIGNCASRTTAMINKYFDGVVPDEAPNGERITFDGYDWPALTEAAVTNAIRSNEALTFDEAVNEAMHLVRKVDYFINETEPFKRAKDESKRAEVGAILYQCLETLRIASLLLNCVLPDKTAAFWQALGLDIDPTRDRLDELGGWGGMPSGQRVSKVALFPRVEEPIEPATA